MAVHSLPSDTCSCWQCRALCGNCPCMGTPKEIQALIDAGYSDRLMICTDNDPSLDYTVVMPKIVEDRTGKPKKRAGESDRRGRCVFYQNFQCLLHSQGLKPSEGRVAMHDVDTPRLFYHHMARSWNGKQGRELVEKFRNLVNIHGITAA